MIKRLFSYATGGGITAGPTELCSEEVGPSMPHGDNKTCVRTHSCPLIAYPEDIRRQNAGTVTNGSGTNAIINTETGLKTYGDSVVLEENYEGPAALFLDVQSGEQQHGHLQQTMSAQNGHQCRRCCPLLS